MGTLRRTGVAAVLAGGLVLGLAPPSQAESLAQAQTRAAQLRQALDRLQTQAEVATEDYDGAQVALGKAVQRHVLAQQALDAAQSTAGHDTTKAAGRIRALYISGGATSLYATVLGGGDVNDALTRLRVVRGIVGRDQQTTHTAQASQGRATELEARLRTSASQQIVLATKVDTERQRVEDLLAQTTQLLGAADGRVRQIAAEQAAEAARRAAQLAAAQLAAAQLAAARSALGGGIDPATLGPVTAPTEAAAAALRAALSQVGKPYLWGATGPGSFDCSGLTSTAYAAAGVALPRTSREQWYAGPHVALGDLAPGDLLFWATDTTNPGSIHHVALYLGDGRMVEAPHTGALVRVVPVYLTGYIGAVRPTGAPAAPAGTG